MLLVIVYLTGTAGVVQFIKAMIIEGALILDLKKIKDIKKKWMQKSWKRF